MRFRFVLLLALAILVACSSPDAVKNNGGPADHGGALVPAGTADGGNRTPSSGNERAGQCQAVAPDPWPEADISDPSTVAFDDKLFITVDGARFFPIGWYHPHDDAAGLAAYKSEGFNIALGGPGCCGGTDLQDQLDLLDRARDAGIFFILHPWSDYNAIINTPEEDVAATLAARNGKGSLFGWYNYDEPGIQGIPKVESQRIHELLSTYDPNHLDTLVEAPQNPFTRYVDDCAVFMVDPYPSPFMPLSYNKAEILEALAATQGTKPVMSVPQGFSWKRSFGDSTAPFRPDGLETRNMAWQDIILGVKGLIYWTYDADYSIREDPETWAEFETMVAEINELGRVILADDQGTDLAAVTDWPETFDYSVKKTGDTWWVLSVSERDRSSNVSLDLSTMGQGLCIVDYTTGESFEQTADGRVAVKFGGYQVRILEVMAGS